MDGLLVSLAVVGRSGALPAGRRPSAQWAGDGCTGACAAARDARLQGGSGGLFVFNRKSWMPLFPCRVYLYEFSLAICPKELVLNLGYFYI